MPVYRTCTVSSTPCVRSFVLATLVRQGATIYRTPRGPNDTTDPLVEVREAAPVGISGFLPAPSPLPETWVLVSP